MIMGVVAFGLFFLTWLLFIIFYSSGVVMDDTCVALSEYYYLDCMAEPGKTCQRDKLTELFQCPDITKVGSYYTLAYNLIDSQKENGAGANQYGALGKGINYGYATATAGSKTKAPAGITVNDANSPLGFEPYSTCSTSYPYSDVAGNRSSTCVTGSTNTGINGPQNTGLTTNASSTGTNPGWDSTTCAHACLNNSALGTGPTSTTCVKSTCSAWSSAAGGYYCSGTYTDGSGCILDSLTNLGGNCMFRKFAYETLTSTYSSTQGYASCGSSIAWKQNDYVNEPQKYQNFSSWMIDYSDQCIADNYCSYTTTTEGGTTYKVIPFDSSTDNPAACLQAAGLAAVDIMYALSYIGSCEYIKKFALLTAVESSGACFDLGDGLLYLFAAQGLIGFAYFIVVFVGIWGYRCFNDERYEENASAKGEGDQESVFNADNEGKTDGVSGGVGVAMAPTGGATAAGGGPSNNDPSTQPYPQQPAGPRDEWV
jgi:hypothetical protein